MTSSELIGRETMISRLIDFHRARIQRVWGHSPAKMLEKLGCFDYNSYRPRSTRSICKEYDECFQCFPLSGTEAYETRLTTENL